MNRLVLLALAMAAAIGGYLLWERRTEQRAAAAERDRIEAMADLQREANRSRSRDVERSQAERAVFRDRFITETIVEIRHAAAPLAACPVPDAAVRLLNDAANCAAHDVCDAATR